MWLARYSKPKQGRKQFPFHHRRQLFCSWFCALVLFSWCIIWRCFAATILRVIQSLSTDGVMDSNNRAITADENEMITNIHTKTHKCKTYTYIKKNQQHPVNRHAFTQNLSHANTTTGKETSTSTSTNTQSSTQTHKYWKIHTKLKLLKHNNTERVQHH